MSEPFRLKGFDGQEVAIPAGEYYFNTKARARRMMLNSLSSDARRAYACLELATMGFRQELAVTLEQGKQRPLTPGDIARQTGLSKQNTRRGLCELEMYGLAQRVSHDGKALRHGRVLIHCWANPRDPQATVRRSNGARLPNWFPETWKPFIPLISRFKIRLIPDEVVARDYFDEGAQIARDYRKQEEVVRGFLKRVCARPALNKEERNRKKNATDNPPPAPPGDDGAPDPLVAATAEEEDQSFETFKANYPQNRFDEGKVKLAFQSLTPKDRVAANHGLHRYVGCERWSRSFAEDGGRWIPLGSTWLRERQWENQPPPYLDIGKKKNESALEGMKQAAATMGWVE